LLFALTAVAAQTSAAAGAPPNSGRATATLAETRPVTVFCCCCCVGIVVVEAVAIEIKCERKGRREGDERARGTERARDWECFKAAVADKRAAAERELNQCLEEENLATAVSQPSLARFRADFPHRDAYVSPLATAARK